jgi:copper chaperone CopZ|tara:strand:+ start:4189 stop:4407 length:219 start_codon:yes stop_codon:yes gene_type:complete
MKTTILRIDSMRCDGCARTIETLLGRLPGVRRVEASFDQAQARILHDRNAAPLADLMAAVTKAGFTATTVDR